MKTRNKLLSALAIAGILTFLGFQYDNEPTEYEYATVVQAGNRIYLTYGTDAFDSESVLGDKKLGNSLDFRPVLKRITELEKEGWLIANNQVGFSGGVSFNYFLMKREKK
ncbi:hypothetical protein GC194_10680 [bacterium]|nr:hypothetical protein [bacterium]